ncbi:MAG: U32 family peptidase [Bacteroidales bacterium]|nr:U32 family peptidase [Bacteroidales bacterium]
MRYLELLAPARDIDIGIAAVDCGADAVYIAGPAFGARQAAANSVEDLSRLCDYAHKFGARVYVTINTIIYDSEIPQAAKLLNDVRRIGADAVIAQDMALLSLNAERPLPLHASTQCAIRTPEKAAELEALGFSRVTLERELSLEQIRQISAAVNCEVECFVHGAMCVCYSGQCYLSELLAGRSANRGACVQACRSRYDVVDKAGRTIVRNKAVLSLKDYNLKSRLKDLADAGVTSFKIEGRLKNISYVRNTVRDYSLALDDLISRSAGRYARASFGRVHKGFTPDAARTFNRGYTSFLIGPDSKPDVRSKAVENSSQTPFPATLGKVASMDAAKGMGEELGRVTSVARNLRSFKIQFYETSQNQTEKGNTPHSFSNKKQTIQTPHKQPKPENDTGTRMANGDGLAFISRAGEVVGLRADVCEGSLVRCKRTPELYEGATIYRNLDTAFEKSMLSNPCVRLLDVAVTAEFSPIPNSSRHNTTSQSPALPDTIIPFDTTTSYILTVKAETEDGRQITKTYTDLWPDLAENPDRMRAMWTTQLSKTSEIYSFHTEELRSTDGRLPLLSASTMNSIRADLAEKLSSLSCNSRPLYINKNNTEVTNPVPQTASPADTGTQHTQKESAFAAPETQHRRKLTYKDNVANKLAAEVYTNAGYTVTEPAYELTHRAGAELMRTKYCLRRELNLCPNANPKTLNLNTNQSAANRSNETHTIVPENRPHAAEPLYLLNNGRRLTALFDCAHCEMVIQRDNTAQDFQ